MKFYIIPFVIGWALGIIFVKAYQNPREVADAARGSIDAVQTQIEGVRRDQCVRDFLSRTTCFQELRASECDALIVKECGVPE